MRETGPDCREEQVYHSDSLCNVCKYIILKVAQTKKFLSKYFSLRHANVPSLLRESLKGVFYADAAAMFAILILLGYIYIYSTFIFYFCVFFFFLEGGLAFEKQNCKRISSYFGQEDKVIREI